MRGTCAARGSRGGGGSGDELVLVDDPTDEVTVHELIAEGARVVAVVSQRGVHRDHPISAGHAFENEAVYLFSVQAGVESSALVLSAMEGRPGRCCG